VIRWCATVSFVPGHKRSKGPASSMLESHSMAAALSWHAQVVLALSPAQPVRRAIHNAALELLAISRRVGS